MRSRVGAVKPWQRWIHDGSIVAACGKELTTPTLSRRFLFMPRFKGDDAEHAFQLYMNSTYGWVGVRGQGGVGTRHACACAHRGVIRAPTHTHSAVCLVR